MPYTSLYIQREKVRNPVNNLINGTRVLSIKKFTPVCTHNHRGFFAAEKVLSWPIFFVETYNLSSNLV